MPSLKVHCAVSRERTGDTYRELHEWIDAPCKEMGVNHRTERHSFTIQDKRYIESKWGEKGVVEWLFHIALDNLDTAFKEANKAYKNGRAYNYFRFGLKKDSRFIFFDFDRMDDEDLMKEFEDSYDDL